ncbi:Endocytosis and vacuole integrity protein [Entomophthora muscae]|uniref:Endocytosis and vacuole integrity protein n=1 Tax=Entomophthora muscae TaxID=34485 RepID=A0ACC2TQA3_9FUNG|nr:Endocytosis and vacuole integrity protein [Entomophthora muscae]
MNKEDHPTLEVKNSEGNETVPDIQALVSSLSPDAKDAYFLFQDLCYMTAGETPILLKISSLNRTFGLELIESVLTNQPQAFQQYPEFTVMLKEKLCSILLRTFSEKGDFPQTTRIMRIVFLIIRLFSQVLPMEVEIFISILLKILESEGVLWHRILAAEVIRGMCKSQDLLKNIYQGYDKKSTGEGSSTLFQDITRILGKIIQENPNQFRSASLSRKLPSESGFGFQTNEASIFSASGTAMRVQCIDQLDKAEAPNIPEGYMLYLVLKSVDAIISGLCKEGLPNLTTATSDTQQPEALSLELGNNSAVVSEMIELSWTGILTTLSFLVKQPMDEDLTLVVVNGLQRFTLLCGMLGLIAPRDAFMGCIYRNAFPHAASYEDQPGDNYAPSTMSGSSLAGVSTISSTPVLTERHVIFLNSLLAIAQQLSDLLNESWFLVLDALQHVQHLIQPSNKSSRPSSILSPKSSSPFGKEPLTETAAGSLSQQIRQFFEDTKYLSDNSFSAFLTSLVRLATESAGCTFCNDKGESHPLGDNGNGIALTRALFRQEESLFSIEQLRTMCLNTMPRLVNQASSDLWYVTLNNLIRIANGPNTAPGVRTQACETISDILLTGMSCANSMRLDSQERVQLQMVQPLSYWMGLNEEHVHATVQKAALETLDKLLQNSGHSFTHGWDIIFAILLSACPTQLGTSPVITNDQLVTDAAPESKSRPAIKLVRIAFPCLQLICTDFLAPLPLSCLRDCILTVGRFGLQDQDMNTSLTAVGMLWNVLDYIQRRLDGDAGSADEIDYHAPVTDDTATPVALRQLLLLTFEQLAFVCADPRPEVRNGANQTLFRTLSSNGADFSTCIWNPLLWKVLFPLLDDVNEIYCGLDALPNSQQLSSPDMMFHHSRNTAKKQWDETRVLILGGIASVFRDLLLQLSRIPDFPEAWRLVLTYTGEAALVDSPEVALAALRSLSRMLSHHLVVNKLDPALVTSLWQAAWVSWRHLGTKLPLESDMELPITRLTAPQPSQREGEVITALTMPLKATKLRRVDQSILTCFVEAFSPIYDHLTLKGFLDTDWKDLLSILLQTIKYSQSPEYPNDCESLSPLQNAVVKLLDPLLKATDHPTLPFILLKSLPDFCLLAFQGTTRRSPCYVSLCCTIMLELSDLFPKHVASPKLYTDPGLVQHIFKMLAGCIRPKYEGPNPGTRQLPLWKLATNIANKCSGAGLVALESSTLPQSALASFIECYLDTLDVLFSKRPPPIDFTVAQLEADEKFEVETLTLAFRSLLPALRHPTVPDAVVERFIETLQEVSTIESAPDPRPLTVGPSKPSTPFTFLAKEQLAFASLRCLICLCMDASERRRLILTDREDADMGAGSSDDNHDDSSDPMRSGYRAIFEVEVPQRVAHIASPVLMTRCLSVLTAFSRDIPLFGKRPLPRVRRDEILFLLRHLGELSLPPASCHHLLPSSSVSPLRETVTEELLRSPAAHLFLLYPILCQILWCRDPAIVGRVANCLQRIGHELGLSTSNSPNLASGLLPHQ